jgi:hypothetical protein
MMTSPVWKQMPTGRMVDLIDPTPADVDFAGDVAPALSNIARFDGACTGPVKLAGIKAPLTMPWTVLDHLVAGADLMRREGASPRLAALFLLHDAHEAYVGDITTPVAGALAAMADCEWPDKPGHPAGHFITSAIAALKSAWDRAIWDAAGVPRPDAAELAAIKRHDLRMMITERNHMMAQPWRSWGPVENLPPLRVTGALSPRPREELITTFLARLDAWAPAARARACPSTLSPTLAPASAKGARA